MNSRFEVLTMKRIFSLRFLAWLMAGFAGLCVLVVAVENWTGARALASAKLRLEQSGETLDLAALRPKPISDTANFCAIGPLLSMSKSPPTSQGQRYPIRSLRVSGKPSPIGGNADLGGAASTPRLSRTQARASST